MSIGLKISITVFIAALPVIAALMLIPSRVLAKRSGKMATYLIYFGFMGNAAWISYQYQPADFWGWIVPLILGVVFIVYVEIKFVRAV